MDVTHERATPFTYRRVRLVVRHPDFVRGIKKNDIALVKLSVSFVLNHVLFRFCLIFVALKNNLSIYTLQTHIYRHQLNTAVK